METHRNPAGINSAWWKEMPIDPGRPPDVVIGPLDAPYLLRWHLVPRVAESGAPTGSLYLHHFLVGDQDRHLHDHPWDCSTQIIAGRYREIRPARAFSIYGPGELVCRKAESLHRIELLEGPVTTIFCTGPRRREWGFHTEGGWIHWKEYHGAPA